jgi:hypothetical protein
MFVKVPSQEIGIIGDTARNVLDVFAAWQQQQKLQWKLTVHE